MANLNLNINQDNKSAKKAIKDFCKSYDLQIKAQFETMKKESETAQVLKALNNALCGSASKEGVNLPTYYISHFWKYIDQEGNLYTKTKGVYKIKNLNGVTAKGILKQSILNAIESCRIGNRFEQVIINK